MKVLWLTNLPSPYRVDFFNELGNHIELTVLFERETAKDRETSWINKEYKYFNAVNIKGINLQKDSSLSMGVIAYIKKNHYDIIVISNYSTPTAMITITWLKYKKIPFVLVADGGIVKNDNLIKYNIKRIFISSASWWLSTSDLTDKYLLNYGANKNRIFRYPFTSVSLKEILRNTVTSNEKFMLREKINLKNTKTVITVGQFIHRKGFDVLIKAWRSVNPNYQLVIVGSGEKYKEYVQLIKELQLENIRIINFQKKEDLMNYYKAADLFILPTREDIWGLVINEAMANGLPIITTKKCIGGLELVKNGVNGFIIEPDNKEELVNAINIILENEQLRNNMGEVSIEIINNFTVETMAKKHLEIFNSIQANSQR